MIKNYKYYTIWYEPYVTDRLGFFQKTGNKIEKRVLYEFFGKNSEIKPLIIYGKKSLKEFLDELETDRRIRFLDSSIWIRYATNCSELKELMREIRKNDEKGLYHTINALENREFKARLAKNSALSKKWGSSHADDVVPFLFHSETQMHKWAFENEKDEKGIIKKSELSKLREQASNEKPLEWRFLLVDDHATIESVNNDENYNNDDSKPNILPKCQIIQSVLSEYFTIKCNKDNNRDCFGGCSKYHHAQKDYQCCRKSDNCKEDCCDISKCVCCRECIYYRECACFMECSKYNSGPLCQDITIHLDCATTIEDRRDKNGNVIEGAISKIQKTKYDIILMDYLLGKEERDKNQESRKYATDFLKKIKESCEAKESEPNEKDQKTDTDKEEEKTNHSKNKKKIDWQKIKEAFHQSFIFVFLKEIKKSRKSKKTDSDEQEEKANIDKEKKIDWKKIKEAFHQSFIFVFLKEIKMLCKSKKTDSDEENKEINIKKGNNWQKIKGPNGAFRIFFISAFTNAVNERMLAEGLGFTEDYWHISRGACPTTTPHLFSYYLLKTMNGQIKSLSDKTNEKILTLLDLLCLIFEKTSNVRAMAIKNFNNILRMRARYDDLKYDACLNEKGYLIKNHYEREQCKSKLVNSLFTDIEYYDNAFWEHVMHLVYLTAFGTIRQWQEIWEEYTLIKPYLLKAYNKYTNTEGKKKKSEGKVGKKEDSTNPKAKEVMENIETYINKLREQS